MAWASDTKWVVGATSMMFCTSTGMLSRGCIRRTTSQGQQRDDHQQAHLRHRTRDRAEKDAHRRGGEQMQRHPYDEQPDRTFDGTSSTPCTTETIDAVATTTTTRPMAHTLPS